VPDSYGGIAGWYDVLVEPLVASLRRAALAMHPPRPAMRVLDAGCGTGAHLALYRAAGCASFGIDLSHAMLSVARNTLGRPARLCRADASRMPFPARVFDLVLFAMALHELAAPVRDAALEEARRVLRADGRILVLDYHAGPASFPLGWAYLAGILCVERAAGADHFRHRGEYIAAGGLPGLARRHRLAVDQCRVFRSGTFGLYLLRAAD
jgi:ubiquinone/menaquinone biosynthesis C-methylase UbiE